MIDWTREYPSRGELSDLISLCRHWGERVITLDEQLRIGFGLRDRMGAAWSGAGADAWLVSLAQVLNLVTRIRDAAEEYQRIFGHGLSVLAEIMARARIAEIRRDDAAEELRLMWLHAGLGEFLGGGSPGGEPQHLAAELTALKRAVEQLAEERAAAEQDLARRSHAVATEFPRVLFGPLLFRAVSLAAEQGFIPRATVEHEPLIAALLGADPQHRRSLWDALSVEERNALIRDAPERLGNAEGLPLGDRDAANRARLVLALAAAREELEIARAGHSPEATAAARRKVDALEGMLEIFINERGLKLVPSRYLQFFDASGTDVPLTAVALGDLDRAPHAAVLVWGMGSGSQDLPRQLNAARNLYDQDDSTAVLIWNGYRTPQFWTRAHLETENGPLDLPLPSGQVLHEDLARAGAIRLDASLAGLQARRAGLPGEVTTVIGHSYGTDVVVRALALAERGVNAAVLVGSAGLPREIRATDLRIPPGHAFIGEALHDRVAGLGRALSPQRYDPVPAPEGFRGIGTEGGPQPDGSILDPITGHDAIGSNADGSADRGTYLGPRSEITRNLRQIIGGEFSRVTRSEAQDAGRGDNFLPPEDREQ